jgi:hypothetical protein
MFIAVTIVHLCVLLCYDMTFLGNYQHLNIIFIFLSSSVRQSSTCGALRMPLLRPTGLTPRHVGICLVGPPNISTAVSCFYLEVYTSLKVFIYEYFSNYLSCIFSLEYKFSFLAFCTFLSLLSIKAQISLHYITDSLPVSVIIICNM